MTRDEAIAAHGVHYTYLGAGLLGNWDEPIREVLGLAMTDMPFIWGSEEACKISARQQVAKAVPMRISQIDNALRSPKLVAARLAARFGLWKNYAADEAQKLIEERSRLAVLDVATWEPAILRLPETVRVPVAIPVSHVIHRARLALDGNEVVIDELPVVSRQVWGSSSGVWDYVNRYELTDGTQFVYNFPDFRTREIPYTVEGWRLFLDRAAAQEGIKQALMTAAGSAISLFK